MVLICISLVISPTRASLVAQRLKRLPGMWEIRVWRPGSDPWVGKIPWRRKWQPTPAFLPGESHGGRSLVGYSPRGCKESDTTELLHSLNARLSCSGIGEPLKIVEQWKVQLGLCVRKTIVAKGEPSQVAGSLRKRQKNW